MPLYRCTTAANVLDDSQRAAIAGAITDIHCDATGAPPTFVHVQFHEAASNNDGRVTLHGGIRAGRPPEVAQAIISRCIAAVAEIAGIAADRISMRTSETPASWIFEGGRVLPEPGEEEAWLAAHA